MVAVDPGLPSGALAALAPLSAAEGFDRVLADWGEALGPFESALLLLDFADHIGVPQFGIEALERVLPTDPYRPVGAAAPLALRLAELLARNGDQRSSDRAIALLNQAERSRALPKGDRELPIARARVFSGGARFDDAIRELSVSCGEAPEAQMLELALLRAECLRRLGRWQAALREYEAGRSEAGRRGYPLFEGRCWLAAGELLGRFGNYEEAERSLVHARTAFQRVGAMRDINAVPLAQARLFLQQQKYIEAAAQAEHAALAAMFLSNVTGEARARILWAESLYKAGDRAAAAEVAAYASELADRSGDPQTRAECQNMEFRLALDGTSGVSFVPQTPEELGGTTPSSRFHFYMMKAWRYLTAKERPIEQAFEWMALAEIEAGRLASTEAISSGMKLNLQFGQLLNRGNNPESAFEYFTRFREQIERFMPQDAGALLQGIANQADALRRAGRFREALALYDDDIARAERLPETSPLTPQMKFYQATILLQYGFANRAVAKLQSAAADAEKAADSNEALGAAMITFLMRINDLISVCWLALNRPNEGREYVGRVFRLAQILGADKAPGRLKAETLVAAARYRVAAGERHHAHALLKEAQEIAESPISLEGSDEAASEILCLMARNSEPRDLY
jgi:tetratricopeptide (TPR) repeat protein